MLKSILRPLLFSLAWYNICKQIKEGLAMALKDSWKETGSSLGHAFRDLGKTLVKTVKTGVDKADEWANSPEAEQTPEEEKQGE